MSIQNRLSELDKLFNSGKCNKELVSERSKLSKELYDINSSSSLDMFQKAKIHWAIEGDENSKYFHGIVNKKPSHLPIRRVLVEGGWIVDPSNVKKEFLNHLADLERDVTHEEIKKVVWDCGINKSPGLYDILPPGCNSSFIALIPKTQEAKDYLDAVLNKSGFGVKWRTWIQGCLNSAMGSILVNGSPTSEFKFYKGLKQGDPLSPFLFILIMESLHLSFKNVVNAGLYKGLPIDGSLILSYLFYANDVVFVGKWDKQNVATIVNVLKCFFLASGVKINLYKSKLMGIGIPHEDVLSAAESIGCSTFAAPFNFLGVKVGDVLKLLESIRRNIFNGMSNSDRRLALIGWEKIMASKKNGYLCMKGALDNSHNILKRSSPWLDIIREVKRLYHKDCWLSDESLKQTYLRLFLLELNKNITVAAKMRDSTLISSFRRAPRGGNEEVQFQLLRDSLANVLLPQINDRWVWKLELSGDFLVKSARSFIDDSLLPKADVPTIWVKVVPIKINILGWRVCLDKLATSLNLSL
ncbi:RNA-directed DNA polymerase, eukaryota [Tanacetum coccineum]